MILTLLELVSTGGGMLQVRVITKKGNKYIYFYLKVKIMSVDYNKIAAGFSESRKNMKWEEIDYFIIKYLNNIDGKYFLDIGCGSARLLEQFSNHFDNSKINYVGVDLSSEMIKHAKQNFDDKDFFCLSMIDIDKLGDKLGDKKFDYIFFIASFHHLETQKDRLKVLEKVKKLLNDDGIIFMTNWSLYSEANREKYIGSQIPNTTNEYGSTDYNIYFGDYARFYHSFTVEELEYIFKENNFETIENREFENKKNIISIIKSLKENT